MEESPRRQVPRLEGVFRNERDRALGRSAVRRGFLTDAQVEEALREGRPLLEVLAARGLIKPEALEELLADLAREDFTLTALARSEEIPEEARTAARDPERQLAEFILVSPLGRGGAGEVWKAWDKQLHRWVAIKRPFERGAVGLPLERFQREASAVAKLSHPNIVPLHRVGEDRGRPYIVFQLVEGKTLAEDRPSLRPAVELLRTAALAVDYAHREGIVHRDLKPGNLMLDSQGRVWILDFGLAYLGEGSDQLTATGAALGTPSYMSPEQARGERTAHDRSTDIYSLGATLYDLATGHPPFEGASFADLVNRVAREDPPRPRTVRPDLPQELETILQKAMSREPRRRYASARELAEDLGRFLTGEPIAARPTSLTERVFRTVRRRPALWSVAAVVSVAAIAGGLLVRRVAKEREAALATIRETARVSLDAALELRRTGQNAGMARFLPPLEKAYRDAVERSPGLAEPDYQMGRFYRALLDDGHALEHQERALRREPSFAPSRYERAILLSKSYGRQFRKAVETLRALDPGRPGPPSREDAERANPDLGRLREVILRDLEVLISSGSPYAGAARGILAYHQDQFAEARTLLSQAVERDPFLEEAWESLARTSAVEAQQAVTLEDKERHWQDAEAAYSRALERDRGYLPHLIGRGEVRLQRGKLIRQFGRDPRPDFSAADEDLSRALKLDESSVEAWIRRGETRGVRAIHEAESGREPFAFHEAAIKDLSRALELDARASEAWMRRGLVRTNRGVFREERREDGMADFDLASSDFSSALAIDPAYPEARHWRGIERANRGMYRERRNLDGLKDLAEAEEDLTRALELRPEAPGIWLWRGNARAWRANAAPKRREDPLPFLTRAEDDYSQAVKVNPRYADAYFWRGLLRLGRASLRQSRGDDLAPDVSTAEDDFSRTIQLNGTHIEALIHRGHLRLGRADREKGEEARQDYAAAADDLGEALRLNPGVKSRIEGSLAKAVRKARE